MSNRSFRFGGLESTVLFALEEREARVVTSKEIREILGVSANAANVVVFQLVRKKRLIRVRKGVFFFAPLKSGKEGLWSEEELSLIAQLLRGKPYYVGFWAALNRLGMTEQIPRVVQIVTTITRRPFEAFGTRFEFIKVRKLGDWEEITIANQAIHIASREQLILDCLAFPKQCGGVRRASQALKMGSQEIQFKKLFTLAKTSSEAVRRRLGYLLDVWNLPSLPFKPKGAALRWLDPTEPKRALEVSKKWALKLNVAKKELKDWLEN